MYATCPQRWTGVAVIALISCCAGAFAQTSQITIERTTMISADAPRMPHVESWLAANPRDPGNLVAVANAIPGTMTAEAAVYYTKDGGKTWQRSKSEEASGYFHGTDPSISFGPDGEAYFVNEDNARIYAYRSENGGESWGRPIILEGDDHPVIAVDATNGVYHNRVYLGASGATITPQGEAGTSVEFAYSDNGSDFRERNFLMPQKGPDGRPYWPTFTDVAVAPDGTVILIYGSDLEAPEGQLSTETEYWIITSGNGGRTFTEPHHIVTSTWPSDQDRTDRIICFATLAVDSSTGPHRGRIYLAYPTLVDGWERIKVIHSDDHGQTWEDPVEAGHDSTHTDQGVPAVAVSQDGTVGVSWYDRRKDRANDCFQGYFSASLDGGLTFPLALPLQDSLTCPKVPGNERLHGAYSQLDSGKWNFSVQTAASRFPNGGETQGLVGLGPGGFQLVWTNGEKGVMQIVSTALQVMRHPLGRDVTDRIHAHISAPELEPAAHKLSVRLSITNLSRDPMPAPLCLELISADSRFGNLRATSADNRLSDAGAVWFLNADHDSPVLGPGAVTMPLTLAFESSDASSTNATAAMGDDLGMTFRVFDACRR